MRKNILFVLILLVLVLTFGFILVGCASLTNFLNPIHAVNSSGEKIEAARGSGQAAKIEGTEYQYIGRPSVPTAPQKPNEPRKPVEPQKPVKPTGSAPPKPTAPIQPRSPTQPSFDAWMSRNYPGITNPLGKMEKQQEFYNSAEYRRYEQDLANWKSADQEYRSANQRYQSDLQSYNSYQSALEKYERDSANYQTAVNKYNTDMAMYQNSLLKYQQDVATYNKDFADYQANLPKYTADVESEIKSIQASINSYAPSNWIGYVPGKYLIYEGKAK
jgi:hypothetical protein